MLNSKSCHLLNHLFPSISQLALATETAAKHTKGLSSQQLMSAHSPYSLPSVAALSVPSQTLVLFPSISHLISPTDTAAIEAAFIAKQASEGISPADQLSEQDQIGCMFGDQCQGAYGFEYIDKAVCNPVALAADVPYLQVGDDIINIIKYSSLVLYAM